MNRSHSLLYLDQFAPNEYTRGSGSAFDDPTFNERAIWDALDTDYLKQIHTSGSFFNAFVASLSMILVSELGDKTFFIAAILAMKNSRITVFVASMLALGFMTILASVLGIATTFIPRIYIHYTSIVLFVLFGLKMLKEGYDMSANEAKEELEQVQSAIELKEQENAISRSSACYSKENPEAAEIKNIPKMSARTRIRRKFMVVVSLAFIETFSMVFIAEWGDRSQISTLILAAHENVYAVTIGALIGHFISTGAAVLGGRILAQMISVKTITIIGGIIFLLFAVVAGIIDYGLSEQTNELEL